MPILDEFQDSSSQSGFKLKPAPPALMPLSLIAATALVISFFLPWFNEEVSKNSVLDIMLDGLTSGTPIGLLAGIIIALVPISAIVLAISRISNQMENRKLDVLCIAFATFLPTVGIVFYLLILNTASLYGPFVPPKPSLGLIIGILACITLLIDAGIQLNRAKSDKPSRRGLILWGILTGVLWIGVTAVMSAMLGTLEYSLGVANAEILVVFGFLLTILLLCLVLAAMLSLHRKRNLNGQLSLDRSIGVSLIGGVIVAIITILFFYLILDDTDFGDLELITHIAIILTVIITSLLGAFLTGSIVGAIMANPPRIDLLEAEVIQPDTVRTDFYEEL